MRRRKKPSSPSIGRPPCHITVKLDAAKMKQVIDNLLSNAVKYSPPGSHITVHLTVDENGCGFAVRDQGPGIPDNERDKLFWRTSAASPPNPPAAKKASDSRALPSAEKSLRLTAELVTAVKSSHARARLRISCPSSPQP